MTERMKTYQKERKRIISELGEHIKISQAKFDATKGPDQIGYWLQMVEYKARKLERLEELHNAFLLAESQE